MSAPATPASSTIAVAGTPTTGTWRHPHFEEITRRQNASAFGEDQAKGLFSTACLLFLTFFIPAFTPAWFYNVLPISAFLSSFYLNPTYLLWLLRAVLAVNGSVTLLPLFRNRDDIADIPLTAEQRALLGLDPSVSTPGSYVTPPRYARSATPRSSDKQLLSGSPGSGSIFGSSLGFRETSSPYSPIASPLLQRAVEARRRNSLSGSQQAAPTGRELYESLGRDNGLAIPGTPTPLGGGKGPSVSLTNRWFYERNRRSSGHGSPRGVYG
ncbi:putative nuclear pore complex component protein [Neofusicoccum parvum]|uniref:Nuclear pore complex component protein n=2 Tax=Neofusicoccum parvum TaxID=310453 RepID=A0ACB5RZK3_9PEZI|nr:putative nuclear pore complex component protein [Neofusicoccum parvum UCRNP2]GME25944.1 putative nuclear pore complex component protein [Neofusicoccum parvum]GME65822.1 putative nuclear pore complex component protein [Neofusicoccum parvum]